MRRCTGYSKSCSNETDIMENTSLLETTNKYLRSSKIPVFNLLADNKESVEGVSTSLI